MTKEEEVVVLLEADATLMAILTGGIYTDEELGVEGFRRDPDSVTNDAFDVTTGILLPCAIVRQNAEVPLPNIRDEDERVVGINQGIEIYFYEARGRDNILAARQRVYELLEGTRLSNTYPLMFSGDTSVFYDAGPVANSTTVRQDWRCVFFKKPVP